VDIAQIALTLNLTFDKVLNRLNKYKKHYLREDVKNNIMPDSPLPILRLPEFSESVKQIFELRKNGKRWQDVEKITGLNMSNCRYRYSIYKEIINAEKNVFASL
jgi:hypothetical protein